MRWPGLLLVGAVVALVVGFDVAEDQTRRARLYGGTPPAATAYLVFLGLVVVVVLVWVTVRAIRNAPVDDMDRYGRGRRVDLTWRDRTSSEGRLAVEGLTVAHVSTARDVEGRRVLPTSARVDRGLRLLGDTSDHPAPRRYSVLDATGARVARVRGVAGPGRYIDWTLDDEAGNVLRWRQDARAAAVPRVTLVDQEGTAWLVTRTRRTRVRAELPDELDPATCGAVVLLIDDQVERVRRGAPAPPGNW